MDITIRNGCEAYTWQQMSKSQSLQDYYTGYRIIVSNLVWTRYCNKWREEVHKPQKQQFNLNTTMEDTRRQCYGAVRVLIVVLKPSLKRSVKKYRGRSLKYSKSQRILKHWKGRTDKVCKWKYCANPVVKSWKLNPRSWILRLKP